MFHARPDAAYQRLDLGTAQAIVDVHPGNNPYPARTGRVLSFGIARSPLGAVSGIDCEPVSGIEPLTCRLQDGCSAN
jgi:hypothetical protein